jgi:hypothetical protein
MTEGRPRTYRHAAIGPKDLISRIRGSHFLAAPMKRASEPPQRRILEPSPSICCEPAQIEVVIAICQIAVVKGLLGDINGTRSDA